MKRNILPTLMMFALFFIIAFVTGMQNPMGVIIKNQFDTSNLLSQLGNAAIFIAYAFMGIPSGLLLKKIGYKRTALSAIAIGLVGVGVSYLAGQMGSFGIYVVGAFITGFSMCMLNTTVNPMLNTLGGGGKRGNQLIQIAGSINSIAATSVPVIVGILMGDAARATISDASPALFIAIAIFTAAFLVLACMQIPEPHLENSEKISGSPLQFRHFTLGAIAIFMYVGVEVGIPNIANIYMTSELNINPAVAGTIVGTYWFLMLIGRLIGIYAAAKFESKTMLSATSLIAIILTISAIFIPASLVEMPVFRSDISFGMELVPINVLLLVLCGLCTSVMWGAIFNLAVEGLGKHTAAASGIFMTMVCGGGIIPLIQGYVADISSFSASYIVTALALTYMLWYAIFGSRIRN